MKKTLKIILWIFGGLFVFVGPPVLAEWGWFGGEDILGGLYLFGLMLGFGLGIWYSHNEKQKEWVEFKRTHRFERRKEVL